jgi:hypothetical protein
MKNARVIVEKPFGHDLASAQQLNLSRNYATGGHTQGAIQALASASSGNTLAVNGATFSLFPGAVLRKAPPQRLTASQQTVVRVRKRKWRQEGEGFPATGAATATDANPVVMLIVCLLAAASMADDRIVFTSGASPQNNLGATRGPIRFELVRRCGKWDKQNRTSLELCPGLTCQDLSRKRSSFLLKQKST